MDAWLIVLIVGIVVIGLAMWFILDGVKDLKDKDDEQR